MKAKRKKITDMKLNDFELEGFNKLEIIEVKQPEKRKGGIMVKSVDELLDKLRNEAKVI